MASHNRHDDHDRLTRISTQMEYVADSFEKGSKRMGFLNEKVESIKREIAELKQYVEKGHGCPILNGWANHVEEINRIKRTQTRDAAIVGTIGFVIGALVRETVVRIFG